MTDSTDNARGPERIWAESKTCTVDASGASRLLAMDREFSRGTEYIRADLAPDPLGAVKVKPLVWGYHPAGTIAAPPTGHAYIIDTRMKGRVYSVKGFNPEREFGSLDEAKAAAQADYEAHIMAALEPVPAEVTVQEAAKVLLDQPYSVMERAFDAMEARQGEGSDRIMAAALRALSEGTK